MTFCTRDVLFVEIHNQYHRATPDKFMLYKHALVLFKLLNNTDYTMEWRALNFNQILTSRQTKFLSTKGNKKKVRLNALANRVFILNGDP